MDYDFRNKQNPPYYDQSSQYGGGGGGIYKQPETPSSPHIPMYGPTPTPTISSSSSTSFYPRVGYPTPPSSHPPSRGMGIRVALKPEYRITPPPQLSPQIGDIPRSTFQFDFDFERKILAEAEKDSPNWGRFGMENLPSKPTESSPLGPVTDPVVNKYIAAGLSREAVPFAVANYGDNPTKVKEFVNGFTLMREMGFSSNNVAEALAMYDNDTDKALAYFLNNSS